MKMADARITIIWMSIADFLQQWNDDQSSYSRDIVVVDEGHLMLQR